MIASRGGGEFCFLSFFEVVLIAYLGMRFDDSIAFFFLRMIARSSSGFLSLNNLWKLDINFVNNRRAFFLSIK